MTQPAVSSVLEVANWFTGKAENSKIYLEGDKLHALIFLAQVHYAIQHNMQYLIPSLFICDDDGFFEPTFKKLAEFGMPLMGKPQIDEPTSAFLDLIWKKYADKNAFELISLVKDSQAYRKYHLPNEVNIVTLENMCHRFGAAPQAAKPAKKILISQNGPVVVSQWQPRKLDNDKRIGEN